MYITFKFYFITALLVYLAGVIINVLMLKGHIQPQFLTIYSVHIATGISLVLIFTGVQEKLDKLKHNKRQPKELKNEINNLSSEIQEYKREIEQLQRENKAKNNFLMMISDELRTPLSAVIGFSEILLNQNLDEDKRETTELIYECGYNILNKLNEMNTLAVSYQDNIELKQRKINVEQLINEIFNEIKHSKKKTVDFEKYVNVKVVKSDEKLVKQILYTFFENAFKYTKHGKVIFKAKPEGMYNVFSVEDTGIGIPDYEQDIIFDMFTQLDAFEKRKYRGVGMSLLISKIYAEALGAKIRVESKKGIGSTFYLHLPKNM